MERVSKFEMAIAQIDAENAEDPNVETINGVAFPKELLYARRMTEKLLDFYPEASRELQIAVRAQHICRWKIDRKQYPMDRVGYLKWREALKKFHAEKTSGILEDLGFENNFTARVSFLIRKKQLKKDDETQILEDVVCLVFLQYYFDDFASKHSEEKVIDIIQKTWAKMSEGGQEAALGLKLSPTAFNLIKKALQERS
ncbi:DUF4202 domain-containing protein [Sinomicrobium weinanense]|uniref:DUF4202 domain-containing protein n=1 Tax=Sinomicrobium weinanense TaxID=2842200 RepID=A0A926Q173_9FLAO|nr:DUF4202 domain-containing protein [Sinomicrobium weinanense]MBC9795532.1 DUF4202 domain-containing protein [Sinomicrobium weinanense]MBU3123321.1 DUF4202 domain-containing protein [Sinomicrobium weinanense]